MLRFVGGFPGRKDWRDIKDGEESGEKPLKDLVIPSLETQDLSLGKISAKENLYLTQNLVDSPESL